MSKDSKLNRKRIIQFIEYMISGGAYFWSGYALFAVLWSGLHWSLWWSKLAANIFGWTVNFLMQRYWVFNSKSLKGHQTQVTGRYILITLVDFVLDYVIVASLKAVGISPYIGQFISSGFFTFWNYVWYRFWVFPETMSKKKKTMKPSRIAAHRAHGHSAYVRIK
jgi:putative flippase GtrA